MKNGKRVIKLAAIFFAALVLVTGISTTVTYAETPYRTYTVDGYGMVNETQTAYLAYTTLTKFDEEAFSSPSDFCVTDDGEIYVADTGNARILVGDLEGNLIKIVGDGILSDPRGVYVTEESKEIYVCDYGLKEVVVFDSDGEVIAEYGKPDSPLYGDDLDFLPLKIAVNEAGTMFVICDANTNGVVEISPTDGGTFLGYYGTNTTTTDLRTIILRAVLTDAQRAKISYNTPKVPENLAIDSKGLVYTVTRGEEGQTLKRLNIAGTNLYGSMEYYAEVPTGVAPGNHDNVYVVDSSGYIFEFNNEGDLLFVFGGKDDATNRIGLSTTTAGIDVDLNDYVYILDSEKAQIQVYEPSEFTSLLHEALELYSKGRYTESKEPLSQVLEMNSMFAYANQAMGRAYYQEENYTQALKYAKLANDADGYTDAFWEVRNTWLKNYLVTAVLVIVVIFIIWKVLQSMDRKKGIFNGPRNLWNGAKKKSKTFSNFTYSWYFMRHPIDGAYGIAREGRASWSAPSIIMVLFIVEFVINKYLCGFLQKTVREGRYEIGQDILYIVVILFAVTVCNYLVCTITEGEASVKKIYTYLCYSLLPYVIFTPVRFALSHVLTSNEQFLITLLDVLAYAWIVILLYIGIKEVNNYKAGETFKIIFLTIFTILIMALLIFIIYVLWQQVFEFISAIYGEVVYRLGN